MGWTCQTIEKHTNSFWMAEKCHDTQLYSFTVVLETPERGWKPTEEKDGRRFIFHSAEGCRRLEEPQRSPNFIYLKKCLLYIFIFFLVWKHEVTLESFLFLLQLTKTHRNKVWPLLTAIILHQDVLKESGEILY